MFIYRGVSGDAWAGISTFPEPRVIFSHFKLDLSCYKCQVLLVIRWEKRGWPL